MDNNRKNNLKIIKKANREMLDYFNDSFINELENIQNLKTQIFEVDVKIDELEKTKDIYAFKTSSKKSAFTPVVTDDGGNIKGKIIDNQIKDLEEVRSSLDIKIRTLDSSLKLFLIWFLSLEKILTRKIPKIILSLREKKVKRKMKIMGTIYLCRMHLIKPSILLFWKEMLRIM